ncbi:asparagine synthase-related protein [Arthrobacter sp. GMC3]|uniref:asparagine synthase-related protein n=1 Tax=Arthrobacter sp. GMC3 TaxID=2058894 RepID=UPI000CE526D3|nr:asparagine synthase-related protein [Arthrobacter sp. GMC3]
MPFASPLLTRTQWRAHTVDAAVTLWVVGDRHCDEQLLGALSDGMLDTAALRTTTGHYAAILMGPTEMVLVEDPIRSFPLFYSVVGTDVTVSDDALALAGFAEDYVADFDSRIEFRHAAYVAGNNTLYAGVKQVQAGEAVTITSDGGITSKVYRRIHYSGLDISGADAVDAHFTEAFNASMARFLEQSNGRQLVVPLSGGLDSRLLCLYLKEVGYQNVVTFTYGVGKTREVLISESVAAALGQKWLFCDYEEDAIREAWDAPDTADFIKFTHASASLPHIQDWYAVRWLKQEGLIEDNAIFLPGHTIVGNMHDEGILEAESVSPEQIKDLILRQHYVLQPDNSHATNNTRLHATIDEFLGDIGYDDSVVSRLTALEYWNVRERQTKYINNSLRNYEYFGYDWALPMLDREVYLAWGDLHHSVTRNRDWYQGYVNRRYAAATGQALDTFAPTNISAGKRNAVKSVLRRVGLLELAERTISAKAVQNHPMGFNWFATGMDSGELFKFTRSGGNLLGAYADEFLTDRWNSHCQLFTPATAED